MKKNLILIFLIFAVSLFSKTSWELNINSYTGGKIFLNDNIFSNMSYFPKNIFFFTLHFNTYDSLFIDATIKNSKEILNDIPVIYRLSAKYNSQKYQIGFLKDYLGYGKNSYFFSHYILSPYFERYFFGNYNFFGIDILRKFNDFSSNLKIGGNRFNKEIIIFETLYKKRLKFFAMKVVKDNYFNSNLYTTGVDFSLSGTFFAINGFFNCEYYYQPYETGNVFDYNYFIELIANLRKDISLGFNQNILSLLKNKSFQNENAIFLILNYQKHSLTLLMKQNKVDSEHSNKSISLLFDEKISYFTFEFLSSYGISYENENYFQLGFNVSVKYEKD